jgi:hypothetical protein
MPPQLKHPRRLSLLPLLLAVPLLPPTLHRRSRLHLHHLQEEEASHQARPSYQFHDAPLFAALRRRRPFFSFSAAKKSNKSNTKISRKEDNERLYMQI